MKLSSAVDEIKKLSPEEVKSILDGDEKGEYVLLDVRQPAEYEQGRLPGAVLMPLDELESRREELYRYLHRDSKIILYCRTGKRSMAAAIVLCDLGLKNLHIIEGGLSAWDFKTIKGKAEKKTGVIGKTSGFKDVLVIAMKIEKMAYDFYTAARDKKQFEMARPVFQQLAEVELSHMRRLFLRLTGEIPESAGLSHIDNYLKQFDKDSKKIDIEVSDALMRVDEAPESEADVLEAAIEREYIANDFYKRAASVVDDEDVRALLHGLSRDERGHAATLLKQLSQVTRK
ncbi:MAG: rhodanese-like domain-containing protein [Dehalococcoidia bacterium]|jgi:rhodanese-related sulfurtransferase/rubrerythrin